MTSGSPKWSSIRTIAAWAVVAAALAIPLAAAAVSPLLAWRHPIYIAAGFAGVIALGLLLVQPLLIVGDVPGLSVQHGRRLHRFVGGLLVFAVLFHVGTLWITSPPDVIDALLFASPTPFSAWGVIAMWAVFFSSVLAVFRRRLRLRTWRIAHMSLAVVIAVGSVVHAILIEGTMETMSKTALCVLVVGATLKAIVHLRARSKPAMSS